MSVVPIARKSRRSAGNAHTLAHLIDAGVRTTMGTWFAFTAVIYVRNAAARWNIFDVGQPFLLRATDALSILAVAVFSFFVASLYVLRLQPVSKSANMTRALVAAAGTFLTWSLLLLKTPVMLPTAAKLGAALLVIGGNIFGIVSLRQLGRSFSIFPEGRRLVTTGPYRYVRHPLYIAEGIATLGAMINFLSPAAVLIVLVQFALQFVRMGYEEQVLRYTFPEYATYAARTARLVPGLY